MKEVKNLDKQIFKCDNNARDSIWTQNYTLAEITGILYKNSQPEPGIGNGRIYENYKRYEPVSMITKALQQLWEF